MPDLFGQDRELGELYSALFEEENRESQKQYTSQIDPNYFNDQGQQNTGFEELMNMRAASGMGGAMGGIIDPELEGIVKSMMESERKRLTAEQIHNYGVMYGSPLDQQQIDYFEDQLNRDPDQSYGGQFPEFPK